MIALRVPRARCGRCSTREDVQPYRIKNYAGGPAFRVLLCRSCFVGVYL